MARQELDKFLSEAVENASVEFQEAHWQHALRALEKDDDDKKGILWWLKNKILLTAALVLLSLLSIVGYNQFIKRSSSENRQSNHTQQNQPLASNANEATNSIDQGSPQSEPAKVINNETNPVYPTDEVVQNNSNNTNQEVYSTPVPPSHSKVKQSTARAHQKKDKEIAASSEAKTQGDNNIQPELMVTSGGSTPPLSASERETASHSLTKNQQSNIQSSKNEEAEQSLIRARASKQPSKKALAKKADDTKNGNTKTQNVKTENVNLPNIKTDNSISDSKNITPTKDNSQSNIARVNENPSTIKTSASDSDQPENAIVKAKDSKNESESTQNLNITPAVTSPSDKKEKNEYASNKDSVAHNKIAFDNDPPSTIKSRYSKPEKMGLGVQVAMAAAQSPISSGQSASAYKMSPWLGLSYQRLLFNKLSWRLGAGVTYLQGLDNPYQVVRYNYGLTGNHQTFHIQSQSIMQVGIPMSIAYALTQRISCNIGGGLTYNAAVLSKVKDFNSLQYVNRWGYTQPYNPVQGFALLGTQYNINPLLAIQMQMMYGLGDLTKNSFQQIQNKDQAHRITLGLRYHLR